MRTQVTTAVLTAYIMACGLAAGAVSVCCRPELFAPFRLETWNMFINGAVGLVGFVLYVLNVPIAGTVASFDELRRECVGERCDAAQRALVTYASLSAARFVSWYVEFVISLLFMLALRHRARAMKLLRYGAHTCTCALSVATLVMTIDPAFPYERIAGSHAVAPVLMQFVLLLAALQGYLFIRSSRLYAPQD